MSDYSLRDIPICGIRFQPIVSVHSSEIYAWEILSLLRSGVNTEKFFSNLKDDFYLNVLYWQLQTIKNMQDNKRYYFNLPVRLFCQQKWSERMLSLLCPGQVIEIQNPEALMQLSKSEKKAFNRNLEQLRHYGAEVWLDDMVPEYVPFIDNDMVLFDGIKIDKSLLHNAKYTESDFLRLISHCASRVQAVLVEGIETSRHFSLAAGSGCHYLQGFMWPEEKFNMRFKPVLDD